jgi:arylsulfatase A-like enzyme
MEFIAGATQPWCCHLSYIKPHWPYIVPEPYASIFGPQDFLPRVATQAERETDHPVFKGFQNAPVGRAFARDDTRDKVLRAYMGLIKQCDDQMGVLFDWLEKTGRMDDTMIVVTSDHGDFMGDHWMGEKTFFQDASVRVPLIIYDPSEQADATRGTVCDALVECIDLLPTFVDVAGGNADQLDHVLEGRSLLPLLRGGDAPARDAVFCEYDYSATPLAGRLGLHPKVARMFMVFDGRWKMVHFEGGFRPMLFDLDSDPGEVDDLGASEAHAEIRGELYDKLFAWARRPGARTTISNATLMAARGKTARKGVLIGIVEEGDLEPELVAKYVGRKVPDMRGTRPKD